MGGSGWCGAENRKGSAGDRWMRSREVVIHSLFNSLIDWTSAYLEKFSGRSCKGWNTGNRREEEWRNKLIMVKHYKLYWESGYSIIWYNWFIAHIGLMCNWWKSGLVSRDVEKRDEVVEKGEMLQGRLGNYRWEPWLLYIQVSTLLSLTRWEGGGLRTECFMPNIWAFQNLEVKQHDMWM